ncbi:tol-pal system YbgF family protein [Luteolibacter algae]|uniref:Tol-pal system YbgF family protein n=1 Tax=Luteolibacter algae TaxID=454151 RepID=A0ABW5D4W8_9BACT
MTKFISILILAALVAGSWFMFYKAGEEVRILNEQIDVAYNQGDPEEIVPELKTKAQGLENQRVLNGVLLAFLSAGLAGIVVVSWLVPMFANKLTHAVYDSGEEVEADPFHDARSFMAQGEYDAAIESFKLAAEQDPLNRMPWVEIAKIQRVHLENPPAAIETLRTAIEGQAWEENDAAFLMFRLAELYDEDMGDRMSASMIMEQVIQQFPDSRHAGNARNKLRDWSAV